MKRGIIFKCAQRQETSPMVHDFGCALQEMAAFTPCLACRGAVKIVLSNRSKEAAKTKPQLLGPPTVMNPCRKLLQNTLSKY